MKPFIKAYTNDENIEADVENLVKEGVSNKDIYILSHDDDRTSRVVSNTSINNINYNKAQLDESFDKQGDELREKLNEVGLSKEEASKYEEEMDKGKVFLIVKDDKAADLLK